MARSSGCENLETSSLLWLRTNWHSMDDHNAIQQKLRSVINHLLVFESEQECQQYIEMAIKESIILIVDAGIESSFIPNVHDLSQLVTIYIYDAKKETNQLSLQKFKKVLSYFSQTRLMA